MITIRNYKSSDYERLIKLYKQSDLYGGQFDADRDSEERINKRVKNDPEAILICEQDDMILGTLSLIEDGRVAWLFRFAVLPGNDSKEATKLLFERGSAILKSRGHKQVLVYAPAGNQKFDERYQKMLGFEKGSDYTCFWKNI